MGFLFGGVCVWGISVGGFLSWGVSVKGVSVHGCLSSGVSLFRVSLSGGLCQGEAPRMVTSGRYASYWNAFLDQNNRAFHDLSTIYQHLPTSFWLGYSKLKRPIKSASLNDNPFYQSTFNFTFTNILRFK